MKKLVLSISLALSLSAGVGFAQGWPADYDGVMLQGFSWDDYTNTKWKVMEKQAEEFGQYFSLIWVPQSGYCGGLSMGYNPLYYFNQKSSFGNEAELRSMISTFKQHGIGTIADVVINHRQTLGSWVEFPKETYKGETYQMQSTDICADDDGGKCKEWADANGYKLSANKDEGEGWDGYRDLDHNSANVQKCILAYEDFLLNDLGYTGFRYDVAKGFAAKHFGYYNQQANVPFSVGEVWDSNDVIKNWIKGTTTEDTIRSAAFDFQFRYAVRDAVNNAVWSNLGKDCLAKDEAYRRYAVTFIENHDTQDRTSTGGDYQDPIKSYIPAANAFLMAMPGTPCVFLPHWLQYKNDIKQQILARKVAGITNTSTYEVLKSDANGYAIKCGKLLAFIGDVDLSLVSDDYAQIQTGANYYYFLSKEVEMSWISIASAEYETGGTTKQVKPYIYAVSKSSDAKLVYTTDGSEPTAQSAQVSSGSRVTLKPTDINTPQTITLKVGLLVDGEVKNVQTCTYAWVNPDEEEPFDPYDVTIYCSADIPSSWEAGYVNYHVWGSNNDQRTTAAWPGDKQTETVEVGGRKWYARTFSISKADYYLNVVFSTASGSPQSVDVTDIYNTSFFEISSDTEGGKNKVVDVTSQYASIRAIASDNPASSAIYDLQGRRVSDVKAGQLYIRDGRKFMVK